MGSPTAPKMGKPSVNETKFLTVAVVKALDVGISNTRITVKIISNRTLNFTDVTITVQDDFYFLGVKPEWRIEYSSLDRYKFATSLRKTQML